MSCIEWIGKLKCVGNSVFVCVCDICSVVVYSFIKPLASLTNILLAANSALDHTSYVFPRCGVVFI